MTATHHQSLSVVMTNYNHAKFLPEALEGLLQQSHKPLEIIILDDCSTDNSVEIIEEYASRHSVIHVVRNNRNLGVVHNVNRLLEMARGEYFCSTAADDVLKPEFFEKSMNTLAENPRAGLCSTMTDVMDAGTGRVTNVLPLVSIASAARFVSPQEALMNLRKRDSWIMGNTCVYRRQALIEAGGFIPELRAFCDGFIQTVIALRYGVCFIPEVLAVWRLSTGGYAADTVTNLNISVGMWGHAAQLMRTQYKDLFPNDYIDAWEERHLFQARLSAIDRIQSNQMAVINSLWKTPRQVDRLIALLIWIFMRSQVGVLVAYFLLRAPRATIKIAIRIIRTALQRLRFRAGLSIS